MGSNDEVTSKMKLFFFQKKFKIFDFFRIFTVILVKFQSKLQSQCAPSILHEFDFFSFFPILYDISQLLKRYSKNFSEKSLIVPTLV